MMSKVKGTKVEREILEMFWKTPDWAALRTPGSGSARFPSPDIIAGNVSRKLAIECKYTSKDSQYLHKAEIDQLKQFAERFNAEPWIMVKFSRRGHFFISLDVLKVTDKFYVVKADYAKKFGIAFSELIRQRKQDDKK